MIKEIIKNNIKKIILSVTTKDKIVYWLNEAEDKSFQRLQEEGYLCDIGWINSLHHKSPVDKSGNPIPWVTYPFISFIKERLKQSQLLFEFGSGNSTLFYSSLVKSVVSVEHDFSWYESVKSKLPENVQLIYQELERGGAYSQKAKLTGEKFDIIIVDGRDRVNCCLNSTESLSSQGVIVLDDSERQVYQEAVSFFTSQGFRRLDFWGLAPMVNYLKCTSIFYRDNNCLNI